MHRYAYCAAIFVSCLLGCDSGTIPTAGTCIYTLPANCAVATTPRGVPLIPLVIDTHAQFGGEKTSTDKYLPGSFADQAAIAYTLFSADVFQLNGILTSNPVGQSTDVQIAEVNRLIKIVSSSYPTVLAGASGSFTNIQTHLAEPNFDGRAAVDFLIAAAHAQSGEKLVILEAGKITNVALAMAKDPSIIPLVRVYWHASNDLANVDSITVQTDGMYNVNADRDAANYVFQSGVELFIIPAAGQTDVVRFFKSQSRDVERLRCAGVRIASGIDFPDAHKYYTVGEYLTQAATARLGSQSFGATSIAAALKNPQFVEFTDKGQPFIDPSTQQIAYDPAGVHRARVWTKVDFRGMNEDIFSRLNSPVIINCKS